MKCAELVAKLFFVAVLAGRQIEWENFLPGDQVNCWSGELERQCGCCLAGLKRAKNESEDYRAIR